MQIQVRVNVPTFAPPHTGIEGPSNSAQWSAMRSLPKIPYERGLLQVPSSELQCLVPVGLLLSNLRLFERLLLVLRVSI